VCVGTLVLHNPQNALASFALSQIDEPELPWWRVVRADGSLAQGRRQHELLVAEGVPFRGDRVDMTVARVAD